LEAAVFFEQGDSQPASQSGFEDIARRHPRGFTAMLVALAIVVAVGLLIKTEAVTILYQAF
jgi:hypothetical protein